MRVLAVIAAVAAAGVGVRAAAAAAPVDEPSGLVRQPQLLPGSDGLNVTNGLGLLVVTGDAAVLGRADSGIVIVDHAGAPSVSVFGEDWTRTTATRTIYGGRALRFRVVGTDARVAIAGRDLDLSVAASGYAAVKGDAGRLRLLDRATLVMPSYWRTFRLGGGDGRPPTLRSLLRLEIRWMRVQGMSWAAIKRTQTWRAYRSLGGS